MKASEARKNTDSAIDRANTELNKTFKRILGLIREASSKGEGRVYIDKDIHHDVKKKLEDLGYKVEIWYAVGEGYTNISW